MYIYVLKIHSKGKATTKTQPLKLELTMFKKSYQILVGREMPSLDVFPQVFVVKVKFATDATSILATGEPEKSGLIWILKRFKKHNECANAFYKPLQIFCMGFRVYFKLLTLAAKNFVQPR